MEENNQIITEQENKQLKNSTKILTDAFSNFLQATNTLMSLISNGQANDVRSYATNEFNRINNILTPKVTYKIDEEEYDYSGPINLIATDVKYSKKKGYISYITNVNINVPIGYTAFVTAPEDLKTTRAYLVSNIPEDITNISVIYRSYDKFNNFPYEIGDIVGKLILIKTL